MESIIKHYKTKLEVAEAALCSGGFKTQTQIQDLRSKIGCYKAFIKELELKQVFIKHNNPFVPLGKSTTVSKPFKTS